MKTFTALVSLAALAVAHGDHHDQEPIEGPHKGLWYNTLPGDGGTQVWWALLESTWALLTAPGGFRLLGNFDFRSSPVRSLSGHRQGQVRHCLPWSSP